MHHQFASAEIAFTDCLYHEVKWVLGWFPWNYFATEYKNILLVEDLNMLASKG